MKRTCLMHLEHSVFHQDLEWLLTSGTEANLFQEVRNIVSILFPISSTDCLVGYPAMFFGIAVSRALQTCSTKSTASLVPHFRRGCLGVYVSIFSLKNTGE